MPPRDLVYRSYGESPSGSVPIQIFADDPATHAALSADASTAGFIPYAGGALIDALSGEEPLSGDCMVLHFATSEAVDCDALLELDARLANGQSPVLVSVDPPALDAVFACLSNSRPEILVAPSRGERLVALGLMMAQRAPSTVREPRDADEHALQLLTERVAQLAAQIDRLSGEASVFRLESPGDSFHGADDDERSLIRKPRPPLPDPRLVRRIIRQRQARGRFFDPALFADPAWDILLDLTAARAEHTRVSITSLCIASSVPATTALRWIGQMIESGLLERVEDETDRRRAFIQLSDSAAEAMARYFAELGKDAKGLV